MYHDIYIHEPKESGFSRERDLPYKIKVDLFESHVRKISNCCESGHLLKKDVVFTFDDGGKSFYTIIAPILEIYGFRGIFFVSTSFIGKEAFLNENEIRDLHKRGHIIGSHAHTHQHMYTMSDSQIVEEWKQSIQLLSNIIGEPVTYASIPNGDTSKRVLMTAQKYGIRYIYTSDPTTHIYNYKDMDIIGRYVILSDSSTKYVLSIITSSKKRFLLSCRRTMLRIIKAILGNNYIKLKNLIFR